jgi:hypothetical protein
MKGHLILIGIIASFIVPHFSYSAQGKAANLVQCVGDCIKWEGDTATAKKACKSRCANITLPTAILESPQNCMSIFKKCKRTCNKRNKVCRKNCKEALMECK